MTKIPDLKGRKFGELIVVGRTADHITPSGKRRIMWHCKCSCGNEVDVATYALTSGKTVICGHIGKKRLVDYISEIRRETPGTNPALLKTTPYKTNVLHERNITPVYKKGNKYYRVQLVYKGISHEGSRSTLEDAIKLREELRHKYWPNYDDKK